jgi:NAD-dependent DNA ligase
LSQTSSRATKNKICEEFIKSPLQEIESLIVKANDVYYNTGKSILDDADYDILIDLFKEHWPKNAILQQIGAPIRSEIVKDKLPFWMGSMDKVKPNSKTLNNWLDKYSSPYIISEKLDGLSALLCYELSSKDKSINLYTRGNGEMGQNISHLIPILKLNTKEILIKLSNLNK